MCKVGIHFHPKTLPLKNGSKYRDYTGWWFQPIPKILVKLEIFPQIGMKIKNIWNHHLAIGYPLEV